MEEIVMQLMPGFLGVLAGIAAWLKGHAEVNQVKKDREDTQKERDAVLGNQQNEGRAGPPKQP